MDMAVNRSREVNSTQSQLCAVVPKAWGREEWIVNNEKYCGKKLVFLQGHRCSLHYHKIKEESFYILYGRIYLELVEHSQRVTRVMVPGEIAHIKPYAQHRITALIDAEVMEFSTFHMEDDSYRIEESGKIDVASLVLSQ